MLQQQMLNMNSLNSSSHDSVQFNSGLFICYLATNPNNSHLKVLYTIRWRPNGIWEKDPAVRWSSMGKHCDGGMEKLLFNRKKPPKGPGYGRVGHLLWLVGGEWKEKRKEKKKEHDDNCWFFFHLTLFNLKSGISIYSIHDADNTLFLCSTSQ